MLAISIQFRIDSVANWSTPVVAVMNSEPDVVLF